MLSSLGNGHVWAKKFIRLLVAKNLIEDYYCVLQGWISRFSVRDMYNLFS